jgi:hypothetical protein
MLKKWRNVFAFRHSYCSRDTREKEVDLFSVMNVHPNKLVEGIKTRVPDK